MQKIPFIFDCLGGAENKKRGNCPFGRVPSSIRPPAGCGKEGYSSKGSSGMRNQHFKRHTNLFQPDSNSPSARLSVLNFYSAISFVIISQFFKICKRA
ncbi:hypothetical protein D7X25_08610 [bacterium 1XD42-8]|nr:hypothetical protein D7X25_08610 [bacterium 1XD42-8]